jgi:hypothetical protein
MGLSILHALRGLWGLLHHATAVFGGTLLPAGRAPRAQLWCPVAAREVVESRLYIVTGAKAARRR